MIGKTINVENNLIGKFEVQDDGGNIYVLIISEEVIHKKYGLLGGSSNIKQFRTKSIYTSMGDAVNRIDDDNYEIFTVFENIKVTRIG